MAEGWSLDDDDAVSKLETVFSERSWSLSNLSMSALTFAVVSACVTAACLMKVALSSRCLAIMGEMCCCWGGAEGGSVEVRWVQC